MTSRKLPKLPKIGKPAFKFKFTVALEYLEVHFKNAWRPKCLQLTWCRGQRQREFVVPKEAVKFSNARKNDIPLEVAEVTLDDPLTSTLLITLYKGSEAADFNKKEYVFALEDNLGLTRRKLAVFPIDMSEYASMSSESQRLEMEFKPLSKKVFSVNAGLQIYCEFVKKGESGDDDMISNFSHISDDEEFRRMTVVLDQDVNLGFEFTCPLQQQQHSNVGILKNRAAQTKSQLLLDLNIAEKSSLTIMRDSDGATPVRGVVEENIDSKTDRISNRRDHNAAVRTQSEDDFPSNRKPNSELRKRISALYDVQKEQDARQEARKTSKGTILSNFKSGVKAVFQGRKESLNSPTATNFGFDYPSDASKASTLPTVRHHGSSLNEATNGTVEYEEYRALNMKIIELEEKNQELCLACGNLEKENASLQRDTDELQSEITELQLLVEDLRNQLTKADAPNRNSQIEQNRIFEQMNLCGWLCKRGVKGGPVGKRWQRRWFQMDAKGYLYYYKENNNKVPRGFIALDLILAVEDVFPLHQDKNNASFNVITDGRVYELMARDEEEKERWINALDMIRSWRAQMANVNL